MKAGPWTIPERLEYLIKMGIWPATPEQAGAWGAKAPVSTEVAGCFAEGETEIYFDPPPFRTISERIAAGESFWTVIDADPSGIDPASSVLIGDFGPGSDSPIILDYRENPADPFVKYLRWGARAPENRWVTGASSFDEFCEMLELPKPPNQLPREAPTSFPD
jgi:hypothetical protein